MRYRPAIMVRAPAAALGSISGTEEPTRRTCVLEVEVTAFVPSEAVI
jgi:hypothetical protein